MAWREVERGTWSQHPYRIIASRCGEAIWYNVYLCGRHIGRAETAEGARALCDSD